MKCLFRIAVAMLALAWPWQEAMGDAPQIRLSSASVMHDEAIDISVTGLEPWQRVTLRLNTEIRGKPFTSTAHFYADARGKVDVATQAPVGGSYYGVDPMGLFWSMTSGQTVADQEASPMPDPWELPLPQRYELTAQIDGRQVVASMLERVRAPQGVRARRLEEGRLRGVLFLPPGDGPHPGMLVVGGSEGGCPTNSAIALASRGYAALALAYFAVPDLPEQLVEIPLEYFGEGLQWLSTQPEIDSERIGAMGGSRGGELALLLGSTFSEIRAVVATVPSHVVWPGCCTDEADMKSGWTQSGQPLRFMDRSRASEDAEAYWSVRREGFLANFWLRLANPAVELAATIPVERIRGPVLLISGGDDQLWPASYMADLVMQRLEAHAFEHRYIHLRYDDAGHAAANLPYWPTARQVKLGRTLAGKDLILGGTAKALAYSQRDAWQRTLDFLEASLR